MPSRKQVAAFFWIALFLCSWHLHYEHNYNTIARAADVLSVVDLGALDITLIRLGIRPAVATVLYPPVLALGLHTLVRVDRASPHAPLPLR
jgi:hypothetical protein